MKLFINCINCGQGIRVKDTALDRADLARKRGNALHILCPHCGQRHSYKVNSVKAKARKSVALIAFILILFGSGLTCYLIKDYLFLSNNPYNTLTLGGILTIPMFVAILLEKQERNMVARFNGYYVNTEEE